MRIAVAQITQEQNTFNPAETGLDAFRALGLWHGAAVLDEAAAAGMIGGLLDAVRPRLGPDDGDVELVPLVKATAVPGGRVSAEVLSELTDMLVTALRDAGGVDGLALLMHGACSATGVDDVEGHLLAAARSVVGDRLPIVVGLDHHANITAAMAERADAIIGHRTQPHNPFDTGALVGGLLLRVLDGAVRPSMSWRKLRLLSHQEQYLTAAGPMKVWFDRARELEGTPGVLSISPFPMQPWLDVDEGGWSVVVVTDSKPELGEQIADELADLAWSMREQFQVATAIEVAEAVPAAAATLGLVVLSDTGDSVFGGAGGDSTVILAELLRVGGIRALVPLVDAAGTAALRSAGVGATVDLELGGGITGFFSPVRVSGKVIAVDEPVLRLAGYPEDVVYWGPVALVDAGGVVVAVSERPGVAGNHPGAYQHFGLDPADFDAVVLKTASNFQYFRPFTDSVIRVNTPGPSQSDIIGLPWARVPRPMYPLDDIDSWRG